MLCVEEWFRIRWAGTLMPDFLLVGIMVDYDVGSGLFFFLLVVLLLCFFHLWDTGKITPELVCVVQRWEGGRMGGGAGGMEICQIMGYTN